MSLKKNLLKMARLTCAATLVAVAGAAHASVVYSSLPPAGTVSLVSEAYQATSMAEFGDHVGLTAGGSLQSVTVGMVNWAYASQYAAYSAAHPTMVTATGYDVPLTLNLYRYDATSATHLGSLIASQTVNQLINWRPEPTPTACSGTAYFGADAACHNGQLDLVTFNFGSVTVPGDLVFGLAFNTQTNGASPTGVDGPYDSLNYGLIQTAPSIGTDVNANALFRNATYGIQGSGTSGVFSEDTGWAPYVPAVSFSVNAAAVVPEPSTVALAGLGLVTLALARRRRRG